ncbi:MAG: cobaltochelatase subunit CobN [Veillonella parvula]|nr:cobaltochelatase subunit CobN [Veillonella parvula]
MSRLMYISNLGKQIQYIEKAVATYPELIQGEVDICNMKKPPLWDGDFESRLHAADVVLVTNMGAGLDSPFLERLERWLYAHHPKYWIDVVEPKKTDILYRNIDEDKRIRLESYRRTSGIMNYVRLINGAFSTKPISEWEEPDRIPWQAIMGRAGNIYETYDEFMDAEGNPDWPSIAVYFYRDEWIMGDIYYQQALFEEIYKYQYNPIIFYGQYGSNPRVGIPNMKLSMNHLFGKDIFPFDVLINTCKFSFQSLGAQTLEELKLQDVPIVQGYTIYMDEKSWAENPQGVTPLDVNLSISQPELDGVIQGGVVACQTYDERGHYNYPPKNSNIGSAAGLDTPESVLRLLRDMKAEGYTIDTVPETSADLMDVVTSHMTNDRSMLTDELLASAEGRLSSDDYKSYFATLPEDTQTAMVKSWGEAPGDVFVYDDDVIIPGFSNGNLWITVQPPRGFGENVSAIYHDPCLPPPHQYLAFYHWVRDVFEADAVIHVGTHGSLEWLPGKGAGLSASCYPEIGISSLPNIYPYWTTIIGEGIQAKRRSSACLVGHLSPPMTTAGLYDEFEELEALLDEHSHFEREHPESVSTLGEVIREKAMECHLIDKERGSTMTVDDIITEVHEKLSDLKHMQMRNGLHILGQGPEGEALEEFITAIVSTPQGEIASGLATIAEELGYDWSYMAEHAGEIHSDGIRYSVTIDRIWNELRSFVRHVINIPDYTVPERLEPLANAIVREYIPKLGDTKNELTSISNALQGRYVEPGPGGAPSSGQVDVLPTGRNFYGLDERALPTKIAYQLGIELADQVIADYILNEQRYPETIGIILWATSNSRSHGQCLGEFLYLLGVRPKWQSGGRVSGLEVIPLEELQRPRIDVMGRISGLIRDMMPTAIGWLDKAVEMVAELDESLEDNYVKKHIHDDVDWLVEQGEDPLLATKKARLRIFGDPPQAYGTGVGALIEGRNWESLQDIAQVYSKWSSFHLHKDIPQDMRLFQRRLTTMDVTIKNEDNRETHIMSADDYYSYHGGLIAAVRTAKGSAPRAYVGDSSDRSRVVMRPLGDEIRRVVQGETQNPKFIQAMMKHGYKGASDMSNVVSHTFGWDATSDVVPDWVYEGYANKYALDKTVQDWMSNVNPWALQRITEILLEASQRGYWDASPEILQDLQSLFISMEGVIEGR